jgi:hypothetical protein
MRPFSSALDSKSSSVAEDAGARGSRGTDCNDDETTAARAHRN